MKQLRRSNLNYWLLSGCLALGACNGNDKPVNSGNTDPLPPSEASVSIPVPISYDIVNEYPHDPAAFTEGLEYRNGVLFEGTGQYGTSDVRKVDLKTGKTLSIREMEPRYFGEGITLLNGKLYQLTYREGKGFIYDTGTLKQVGNFTFNTSEGWGMTNNGSQLIFNDGGNVFHYVDPVTLNEVKQLKVTDEHGPVNALNEPELINGFIYANVWQTDLILKIDTTTGRVVGKADLSNLRQRIGIPPPSPSGRGPEVLNGIAYDAANNRIYITGKNWPKLIEIRLDN